MNILQRLFSRLPFAGASGRYDPAPQHLTPEPLSWEEKTLPEDDDTSRNANSKKCKSNIATWPLRKMSNTALYDSDAEEERRVDDDLETASLTDIDSPADGYFEQRNIPQQTYIHNPASSGSTTKEEEEARLRYGQPAAAISQPEQAASDQPTPLLDAGPAPPDYAAATAGRIAQQEQSFGSDHPLVRNGLVSGQRAPDSRGQQPESMSDERSTQRPITVTDEERNVSERITDRGDDEVDEETALLPSSNSRRKARKSRSSRCMKISLMLLGVVLLIIIAVIATKLSSKKGKSPGSSNGRDPNNKAPIYRQPPNGPTPPHPSRNSQCTFTSFSETRFFPFSPPPGEDFSLEELIDSTEYIHLFPHGARISGTVKVSPATPKHDIKGYDIGVWINFAMSDSFWIESTHFNFKTNRSLKINFPTIGTDVGGESDAGGACFDIAVAVHVQPGTQLGNFALKTAHMDVVIDDGVFGNQQPDADIFKDGLKIMNEAKIWTAGGDVDVPYWSSRRTIVETLSGDIEGKFALWDLLKLSTKSGDIEADVDPREADEVEPLPAEFVAEALSGKIHADFPLATESDDDNIPERDYRVSVDTKSGDISGTYILGSSASFTRLSGDVDVSIMPYTSNLTNSSLSTWTTSGKTKVDLLSPYHLNSFGHRLGIIDTLHSKHEALSGDLEITYPQEWEGEFDAETVSGDIKVRGKEVELEAEWRLPKLMKKVVGRKGDGESRLILETKSGNVDLLIGEE